MPKSSARYIEELTPKDAETLTQLLFLPPRNIPTPEWLRDQATCLSRFPPHLRRPEAILPRIVMALPFSPEKAILCKTHKPLNPQLIRRIFLYVSAECSTHLQRVVESPLIPSDLAAFVRRLQKTNSLWISPDLYRVTFQATPYDERFDRIGSGCEGCILAAVGGNRQTITDLRSSMVGRRTKRGPTPRLLKIVEAWIDWTGQGDMIRAESDVVGRELLTFRRQLQKARRQKKRPNAAQDSIVDTEPAPEPKLGFEPGPRARHDSVADEQPPDMFEEDGAERDDKTEKDLEDSIFDFYYQSLLSSPNLAHEARPENHIHPALGDSVHFEQAASETRPPVARREAQKPKYPTAYTESVYSSDRPGAVPRDRSSAIGPSRMTSEETANEYRRLIGERRWDERDRSVEENSDRATLWRDFI